MFRRAFPSSLVTSQHARTFAASAVTLATPSASPSLKKTTVTKSMLKRPVDLDHMAAKVQARQKEREREQQQQQASDPLAVAAKTNRMPQRPAAAALSSFLSSPSAPAPPAFVTRKVEPSAQQQQGQWQNRGPTVILTKAEAAERKEQAEAEVAERKEQLNQERKEIRKFERRVAKLSEEEEGELAELDAMNIAVQSETQKKPWKYVKPAAKEAEELGLSVEDVKARRKLEKKAKLAAKAKAKRDALAPIKAEETAWAEKTLEILDSELVPKVSDWINETGREAHRYSVFERRVWGAVSAIPKGRAASYGVIGNIVKAAEEFEAENSCTDENPSCWAIIQSKPEEFSHLSTERTRSNALKNVKALNMATYATRDSTTALYKCPVVRSLVPTHRVVRSSGELSGVGEKREEMRCHLEEEGIKFTAPLPGITIERSSILSFTVERKPKVPEAETASKQSGGEANEKEEEAPAAPQ